MARKRPAAPARTRGDPRRVGGALLCVLLVLAAAAIPLALAYRPDPALANAGVAEVAKGPLKLARGVHAWAAAAALALVLLHLARAYVTGLVPSARARALAGLATFAVLVGAYFTGTILPWDQQGWEALQHLRDGAARVGVALPGATPGEAPLEVLFYLHIFAVPALLLVALALHFRKAGARADAARILAQARAGAPLATGVVAAVILAAIALPPTLGPAPIEGLSVSRPDWPFLWLVPLQDAFGAWGLLALPLAFGLLAVGLARGGGGARETRAAIAVILGAALLLLSLLGLL